MPKRKRITVDEARALATKARDEWLAEHSDKIGHVVTRMLDAELRVIVATAIGFDKRYGTWEVDHCNGRAGESIAGDTIRAEARDAAIDWLKTAMGKMPPPTQAVVAAARREYREWFDRVVQDEIRQHATVDAAAFVERLAQEAKADADE